MRQFLHILRYKIRSFFVVSFDGSIKTILKNIAAGIIYTVFALGMYTLTVSILNNLVNVIHINTYLIHRFISIILFIFFLSVNAGNILVNISGLFKSREINFLITKPIPFANIFLIKFFDNFFYSSSTLFVILFAVLYGYGNFFHLGTGFYIFAVLGLFLPFTLIAALLGVLTLMILLHIAKKIGVKLTIAILAILYISAVMGFFAGNHPTDYINQVLQTESTALHYFEQMDSAALQMLPNNWVSNSLYWYLRGDYSIVAWNTFLLFFTVFILTMINYVIARKSFYTLYLYASELRLMGEKKKQSSGGVINFEKPYQKFPVMHFLLKKELALFFRDPSQVLQLSFMIILIVLFAASISGRPHDLFVSLNPFVQTSIYLVFILFNAFFVSSLALRFVFPHQGLEGETFWKILSAPINKQHYLTLKFILYTGLILSLSIGLNYFSHRKFDTVLLQFSSVLTVVTGITVCVVNYGFGIYYANYKEKNPIRAASSQGASAAFLICLLFLGIIVGIMFQPLYQYFLNTRNLKLIVPIEYFLQPLLIIGVLGFIISGLSGYLGYQQSKKDFAP